MLSHDMNASVHYSDHMAKTVTATQAKAHILALLDEVESGEEVEITRHGRLIARLVPARGGMALMGKYRGLMWANVTDEEELFTASEPNDWTHDADNLP